MRKFIDKAKYIHNNIYDYSKVEYVNSKTKVTIICEYHGEFKVTPNNHLNRKSGCPMCKKKHKSNKKIFINRSKKIHNNIYDYSKVKYLNNRTMVKIICPIHGEFSQTPENHLKSGCTECNLDKIRKIKAEKFIDNSKYIHNNIYDYSKVDYINNYSKVKIKCSKHGYFSQEPKVHLKGHGCLMCNSSKGEIEIQNILNKLNINYLTEYKFDNCKNKFKLPFDFYLPEYNICIEYDGRQHFESIDYFGGNNYFKKIQINDKIKNEYCKKNNIRLIRIRYNDFNKIELYITENIHNH